MAEDLSTWIFDLESKFLSIVKKRVKDKIGTKYPKLNFTTTNLPSSTETIYPTVYIHELASTETGHDLVNQSVNAILYSMQVEVVTNQSQDDAKQVMREVLLVFKSLGFSINETPSFSNGNTYYRQIMRVRRMIGAGDSF